MNIFALSLDVEKAARWHVNRHVVKMPNEIRQMLSTAVRLTLPKDELRALEQSTNLWKTSHENHPSTRWARESVANWHWLRSLGVALLNEHYHRWGTRRDEMYQGLMDLPPPRVQEKWLTSFSLAMPSWIKEAELDPVTSYRVFYCNNKTHLFEWRGRNPPPWIPNNVLSGSERMPRVFGGVKERPSVRIYSDDS